MFGQCINQDEESVEVESRTGSAKLYYNLLYVLDAQICELPTHPPLTESSTECLLHGETSLLKLCPRFFTFMGMILGIQYPH